jgi:adenylosuccinate synthase
VRTAALVAREVPWFAELITDVSEEANVAVDRGKKVLLEGTQGFGLSLYHSESYPKVTSRDTIAAAFLSEVGLSPRLVTDIVLVFRTFPIRVAGEQAGPLKNEIKWEDIQRESGYPYSIEEMTTVTKKIRRVARFDWELAKRAVAANRPTAVAVNGLDYIDYRNRGVVSFEDLTSSAHDFSRRLERELDVSVCHLGTGPSLKEFCTPKEALELSVRNV